MSIREVAKLCGLHWDIVKQIEKDHLREKFNTVDLSKVRYLGIDEVYLGRTLKFITVVRDLEQGDVLYIGKGKDTASLKGFEQLLKDQKPAIQGIAMDMANAYKSWAKDHLPDADIVFDHFHVIKRMNSHLNDIRRITINKLTAEQAKDLKGHRYTFLRSEEHLKDELGTELKRLREQYSELGMASLMKEQLRNVYKLANSDELARRAFEIWSHLAEHSGVRQLKQMSKMIRGHLEGILGYWKHNRISNASQEGFNNKIGWLTRQANGYRDEEYLHLKIHDLPNISTRKEL